MKFKERRCFLLRNASNTSVFLSTPKTSRDVWIHYFCIPTLCIPTSSLFKIWLSKSQNGVYVGPVTSNKDSVVKNMAVKTLLRASLVIRGAEGHLAGRWSIWPITHCSHSGLSHFWIVVAVYLWLKGEGGVGQLWFICIMCMIKAVRSL